MILRGFTIALAVKQKVTFLAFPFFTSAFIENFYVFLSEHGYSVRKGAAMDALLYTSQKNTYHPIVEYLERIEKDNYIQPVDLEDIATDYLGVDDELSNQMLA